MCEILVYVRLGQRTAGGTRHSRHLISQCPLGSASVLFAGCGCIRGTVLVRRGWMDLPDPSGAGPHLPGTTNYYCTVTNTDDYCFLSLLLLLLLSSNTINLSLLLDIHHDLQSTFSKQAPPKVYNLDRQKNGTPSENHNLSVQNPFQHRLLFQRVYKITHGMGLQAMDLLSVKTRKSFETLLCCLSQNFLAYSKCSIKVCCPFKLNCINTCVLSSIFI